MIDIQVRYTFLTYLNKHFQNCFLREVFNQWNLFKKILTKSPPKPKTKATEDSRNIRIGP